MKKFKINKNKQGAALMTVIVVMALVLILLVSTLSVSIIASNQTYSTFEEQQAYYTARSTLEGFGATLNNDTTFDAYLATFARTASINDEKTTLNAVSVPGYGNVKVTIKKVAAETVKVTAEVELLGEKNTTSMVLQIPPPQSGISFNNASVSFGTNNYNSGYVSEGGMAGIGLFKANNNMKINGNVYVSGDLELNSSTIIKSGVENEFKIEVTDRIYITNNPEIIPADGVSVAYMNTSNLVTSTDGFFGTSTSPLGIYTFSINNFKGTYYGDVHIYDYNPTYGGVTPDSFRKIQGGTYTGDIYVEGDLILDGVTVNGNIYANGGTVTLTGSTINGNVSTDGTIVGGGVTGSINTGVTTAIPAKPAIPTEEVYFKDFIDDTTGTYKDPYSLMNDVAIQTGMTFNLSDPLAVVDGVYTISGSGTMTGNFQYGVDYVIEVGDIPIHIKWPDNNINLYQKKITIERADPTSNTDVYFYLSKNLEIVDSSIMTNVTRDMIANGDIFYVGNSANLSQQLTDLQNVYWMVADNANVTITNGGNAEGMFYGPGANFDLATGASLPVQVSTDGNASSAQEYPATVIGSIMGKDVSLNNTNRILFSKGNGNTPPPPPNPMGSFEVINYQRS